MGARLQRLLQRQENMTMRHLIDFATTIWSVAAAILAVQSLQAQSSSQPYDPATMAHAGTSTPPFVATAVKLPAVQFLNSNRLVGSDVTPDNLIDVNPATGSFTVIGKLGDATVAALAWDSKNKVLYATSTSTHNLLTIDPATGTTKVIGSFGSSLRYMHGLTYNLRDGKLYGANSFGTNEVFTIDTTSGKATSLGKHGLNGLGDLAYDFIRDKLYLTDIFGKTLHTFDPKTGKLSLVGGFGTGKQIGTALAFDPTLGLIASDNQASSSNDDVLYKIDDQTGKATLIGSMGAGNVLGLEFVSSCLPAVSRGYGQGYPGTQGVPALSSTAPALGKSMTLQLSNSRGAATSGLLILNVTPTFAPAFWGGTLHVSLTGAILLGAPVSTSGLSLPATVPSNAPCGQSVYCQGLLIDPGATAGLSSSAGLEMRIGQ